MSFMNLCMLNCAAANQRDLETRAKEAVEYFGTRKNPWLMGASEDWLGPNAEQVFSRLGLEYKLDLTGMVAQSLKPPVRPLPPARLKRINDEETRIALAHLNAAAYGVSYEWGKLALSAALFSSQMFGRVAYVGDEPASGAFVIPGDRALYVAWVATAKAFRGMGLAELVIRACLEDARKSSGLKRSFLHAAAEGFPVYLRMGYQPLAKFAFYGSRAAPVLEKDSDGFKEFSPHDG